MRAVLLVAHTSREQIRDLAIQDRWQLRGAGFEVRMLRRRGRRLRRRTRRGGRPRQRSAGAPNWSSSSAATARSCAPPSSPARLACRCSASTSATSASSR